MNHRRLAAWIQAASWSFATLGVFLPFAFRTGAFSPYRDALASWTYGPSASWTLGAAAFPDSDSRLLLLMLGITGGSMAGKWIVHALIARGPLADGKRWARDATMAGLLLWLATESVACWMLDATFGLWMVGVLPLALVGVPLAVRWKSFPASTDAPRPATRASVAAFWTSVAGCGTGVAIAFGDTAALGSVWAPWFDGLEAAHYGGAALAESTRRLAVFFFGPIGACTLAQFAMLAAFVRFEGPTARTARAGAVSITAWFLVDSVYGLASEGVFNILLVNVPAIVLLLPAWAVMAAATRRA